MAHCGSKWALENQMNLLLTLKANWRASEAPTKYKYRIQPTVYALLGANFGSHGLFRENLGPIEFCSAKIVPINFAEQSEAPDWLQTAIWRFN